MTRRSVSAPTAPCVGCGVPLPRGGRGRPQLRCESCRLELVAAKQRTYYAANKEKVAAYQAANRDKIAERKRAYGAANRESFATRSRAYYAANRDKIAERRRAARQAKKAVQKAHDE